MKQSAIDSIMHDKQAMARSRWRRKQAEKGKCIRCTRPVVPGFGQCHVCLEKNRKANAIYRERHRQKYAGEEKTCSRCRATKPLSKRGKCQECLDFIAAERRKHKEENESRYATVQGDDGRRITRRYAGLGFPQQASKGLEEVEPTKARPGSEEKIRVLQERCLNNQPLFHPEDEWRQINLPMNQAKFNKVG